MTDLIIKNAGLATHKTLVNILITDQHIARILGIEAISVKP